MLLTADASESAGDAAVESTRRAVGRPFVAGGPSPNPSGRPRKTAHEREAEELAKKRAPWAMQKLVRMAENPKTTEAGRFRALELLLAYGLGKPVQRESVELGENITFVVRTFAVPAVPTRGVLRSPAEAHVWRELPQPDEVVGAEVQEVQPFKLVANGGEVANEEATS